MGYSFAIPSNIAKKVIEDMMLYGKVQRAYLGVNVDDLNADKAQTYEVPNTQGVIIVNVLDGGAAKKAGLKKNDIIVKMNQVVIKKYADLVGFLGTKRPGDKIDISVIREGLTKTLSLTLKNRFGKETVSKTDFVNYYIGNVKPLTKLEKNKFDIDYGVKISNLTNNELKAKGVQNNDIILAVNETKINGVDDLSMFLQNNDNKNYVTLQILDQNGRVGYVSLRLD